ncbi:MAG: EamA family transporter [Lachnospiraceae bacterium]|nr:EamA family transporter [Lachnospiraceae bacterium]
MWIAFAFGSAFFAGTMTILAKIGIRDVNSNLVTALRTVVVVIFAWLMVFIVGSQKTLFLIDGKSIVFLVLSGLATGASWLCYFRALQQGDVAKVVPIDKSSTVLTMLLAFIFLGEGLTWPKVLAMLLIGFGTYLMAAKKTADKGSSRSSGWFIYALLAAVFASLTAILAKIGITSVESNLGTAIRTMVVLVLAWLIVIFQGKHREIKDIKRKSWAFIGLSGLATGLSWVCFFRALQEGPAGIVVPIDKLSILFTIAFGYVIFKEKLHRKSGVGLFMILAGTISLLVL